jgi:hypothetical protein
MLHSLAEVHQCFWRNILLPSSGLKGKPRKKPATSICLLLPCFLPGLHSDPEDVGSTSVNFYWTASYYFLENSTLCIQHRKNLKSDILHSSPQLVNSHLSIVYLGNNFKAKNI